MTTNTIRTVLGDIHRDELGLVLPHEHLYCSQLSVFPQPATDLDRRLAYENVTKENAHIIRQQPLHNLDNIFLNGGKLVEEELEELEEKGIRTIVDLTTIGACRNIEELVRLSEKTSLQVVAGTGYYVERSHPPEVAVQSERWLADKMINEIERGIDETQTRAGIIGEIGTSLPVHIHERKVLAAAIAASCETGRSIVIHVQPPARLGHEVVDILQVEGAQMSRVALAHMDSTIQWGLNYHREILSRGVSIIYDGFGLIWDFPSLGLRTPSDEERMQSVIALCQSGFTKQLLLSQDVCTKVHLAKYGGPGYSHLVQNILPQLKEQGLTEAEITQITEDNPAELLAARKEE